MRIIYLLFSSLALLFAGFVVFNNQSQNAQLSATELREQISGTQQLALATWQQLAKNAEAEDPVAWNNYGVALWRSRISDGPQRAKIQFERAAKEGVIVARYNLALMLPNKFDTAPATVRKQLELLQKNVSKGDVHSMVQLSDALYFVNRDAYVDDRLALKRSLLKTAAASGDTDYIYIYGNELWRQTRGTDGPNFLKDAIEAFLTVDAAGDPRGAEALGSILRTKNPKYSKSIEQAGLTGDAFEWYARAGDLGSITARCAYGNNIFRSTRFLELNDTPLPIVKALFVSSADIQGRTPQMLERAVSDLKQCAKATGLPRRLHTPFGNPALYSSKSLGPRTALFNSPGHASLCLGILYGFGIVVKPDHDLAVHYLNEAIQTHGFTEAKAILNALPDW